MEAVITFDTAVTVEDVEILYLLIIIAIPILISNRFTQNELYTTMDAFRLFSHGLFGSETRFFSNASGLANLDVAASPAAFWKQIQQDLVKLPMEYLTHMTKVVLTGDESIATPEFQRTLKNALHEVSMSRVSTFKDHRNLDVDALFDAAIETSGLQNPVFAAARGAALYARWRQESPFFCYETDICETERERERQNSSKESVEMMELK